MQAYPVYPFPWWVALQVGAAALAGRRRSFQQDARRILARARVPVRVLGVENIPQSGPAVVVFNHYSRPGFGVWWLTLAIAVQVPVEMFWAMSAEWTTDGTLPATLRAAWSRWFFPRLARVYGFASMPPMPPRPFEVEARARAVRQMLAAARCQPAPVFGLAPEGRDTTLGRLEAPPPGAGRLLQRLAELGCVIHPLGAWEAGRALVLSFGPPFTLRLPESLPRDQADQAASTAIMNSIARQLPVSLRGIYAEDLEMIIDDPHAQPHPLP